jgi:hypothetical protein
MVTVVIGSVRVDKIDWIRDTSTPAVMEVTVNLTDDQFRPAFPKEEDASTTKSLPVIREPGVIHEILGTTGCLGINPYTVMLPENKLGQFPGVKQADFITLGAMIALPPGTISGDLCTMVGK